MCTPLPLNFVLLSPTDFLPVLNGSKPSLENISFEVPKLHYKSKMCTLTRLSLTVEN